MDKELESKYLALQGLLEEMGRVLIAFSGGVDSAFLLKTAMDVLGKENVCAITAFSETIPGFEIDEAIELSGIFGAEHHIVESFELSMPDFVKNPVDRCYICKKYRFGLLVEFAQKNNLPFVLDGSNFDDKSDYRPGMKAIEELNIRSPILEAGLSKNDVRTLSKSFGLFTYNKPSYACLATRIPYHYPITAEKLRQVEEGEKILRDLGFHPNLRVRHYGDTVRIEVDPKDLALFSDVVLRDKVLLFFKKLKFEYITVDLEGYSMGSMNKILPSSKGEEVDGE